MISALPTYGWASFRIRRSVRLFALLIMALLVAALAVEPWVTLAGISLVYLATIPFGMASYAKVRRRRAAEGGPTQAG
jgi:CDP-diacylglycerol--serine O-phosphatidyltransferase